MKINRLAAAIAATSIVVSTQAIADGHSNSVTSALANGKLTGQVYGGLTRSTTEVEDSKVDPKTTNEDTDTEFDFDYIRMGYIATVKEDVEFGIEAQLDPGNDVNSSSSVTIRDLYGKKSFGNNAVTLGRFKPIYDREAEQSDALFTNPTTGMRIDGVEFKGFQDTGLNYSASIQKGGLVDEDSSGSGNSDDETEDNFGISLSAGWQGGDNGLKFGGFIAFDQTDGDETSSKNTVTDVTTVTEEEETDKFIIGGNLDAGTIVAILRYTDTEVEDKSGNTSSGFTSTTTETDGFTLSGAFDLGGANRSFDQFGVLQGPKVANGEWGQEIVLHFSQTDTEWSQSGVSPSASIDTETDTFGIGYNAYCGKYTKLYALYETSESEAEEENVTGSIDTDGDTFTLGLRLAF